MSYDLDRYKNLKELKNFTEKLIETTVNLQTELQQTKDKLTHLEQITKFSASPISVGSSEEEVCKIEINRLLEKCKKSSLEFNDIKAFEIYVKSLMLIKGKVADSPKKKKEVELNQDKLIELAMQQVIDEPTEQ